jgi:hypothetical protein
VKRLFRDRAVAGLTLLTYLFVAGCGGGGGSTPGNLTGAVTDAEGRAVAGATVAVGSSQTKSLSNGTFTLSGIRDGFQKVVAANTINGRRWSGETMVDLVGNEQNRSLNIVISDEDTQGTIFGSVIGPNGFGLEGAKVFIAGPLGSTLAVADRDGNYVANRIPSGFTYTVTCSLAGFVNDTKSVHVSANQTTAASFALTIGTSQGAIPAPTGLSAQAWTVADTISRSTAQSRGVYDWLKKVYRKKSGLPETPKLSRVVSGKAATRSTPNGSVIEVDLFWTYQSFTDLFGYAIRRSTSSAGVAAVDVDAVLRDPLADAFFDVDPQLTPQVPYFYTVSRLDTVDFPDNGLIGPASNVASVTPLGPVNAQTAPTFVAGNPVFAWNSVTGAAAYQIYVWDQFPALQNDPSLPSDPDAVQPVWPADFNSPGSSLVTAPNTSQAYQGPALISGHTYYWMVVAVDAVNPSNIRALSASRINKFAKP